MRPLTREEIRTISDCFVETMVRIKEEGFDGVQLPAMSLRLGLAFVAEETVFVHIRGIDSDDLDVGAHTLSPPGIQSVEAAKGEAD